MKKILGIILMFVSCFALVACGDKAKSGETTDLIRPEQWLSPGELLHEYEAKDKTTVMITVSFTDDDGYEYIGYMPVELFDELAPKTVKNFKKLVEADFYDGLTFHRVIEDFMLQGGNPELKGKKESDNVEGEFENNDFFNNLELTRGVIAMARISTDVNSASSQFFILQNSDTDISGDYAGFGVVIECADKTKTHTTDGKKIIYDYDVIDKICSLTTDDDDAPEKEVTIVSIEIVTNN